MSGNPSTPSNVVPMPTNWPGPMFMPKSWGAPGGSPSCFSELAALNACYDSVQMMEQILAKVITDLVTNNAAVQKAIVEAIAASGSNVPLIGVTNGSNAQPGQVGEYVQFQITVNYPAGVAATQTVTIGVMQPGDWDCWAVFNNTDGYNGGINFVLAAGVVGFSTDMQGFLLTGATTANDSVVVGTPARLSIATPTLVLFSVITNQTNNAGSTSTTGQFLFGARRAR